MLFRSTWQCSTGSRMSAVRSCPLTSFGQTNLVRCITHRVPRTDKSHECCGMSQKSTCTHSPWSLLRKTRDRCNTRPLRAGNVFGILQCAPRSKGSKDEIEGRAEMIERAKNFPSDWSSSQLNCLFLLKSWRWKREGGKR